MLVTLADTPGKQEAWHSMNDGGVYTPLWMLISFTCISILGLADTEGDDEKNIPILKEYIKSIGKRLGVTAFLLVFKIDSG